MVVSVDPVAGSVSPAFPLFPELAAACAPRGSACPPRPRAERGRGPLSDTDRAALVAEADAVDRRVKALVVLDRKSDVEMAYALLDMKRGRLYEVYGLPDLVSYARARGVARSRSQVKQMVRLVERLESCPDLRALFLTAEGDWTKVREVARELFRADCKITEAEAVTLVRTKTEDQLRQFLQVAHGESPTTRWGVEIELADRAALEQMLQLVRETDRRLKDGEALGVAARAFVQMWRKPGDRSPLARINVHVALAPGEELGPDTPATIEARDGPAPVPPALMSRLLGNAEVLDRRKGPGARLSRAIPPTVANEVHARDRGKCRAPGCSNMGFLQNHHLGGWRNVGHDPARLLLLCEVHHRMHHEGLLPIDVVEGGFLFSSIDGSPPRFVPYERAADVEVAEDVPAATGIEDVSDAAVDVVEGSSDAAAVAGPPTATVGEVLPAVTVLDRASEVGATAADGDLERGRERLLVELAVAALVALELKKVPARQLVRRALEELRSRGEPFDEGALVGEALRQMP